MRLVQVDAFTSEAFKGNPAAVCLLDREREDAWMQNVAAEMNLAATAFLLPRDDGFSLRWFTPAIEIALCGHATLASAHTLWSEDVATDGTLRFHTKSGVLTATRAGEWIELDFPATPEERVDPPPVLLESLGIANPVYIGRNPFDYLVEVDSEETLRGLDPDHSRLRTIPVRGVIVTSRSSQYDFVSRFFAPAAGIDEDSLTGSAHCCLAPYWASRLGKEEMTAFQASKRGGVVRVRLAGDRVKLGGRAVTVLRGTLEC
ncbi:MAG TPA: PhzF family phenazine biosynthesis protein [Thermoanaerobaculia bacterium]|nr:PhzF family phenazine biosynthesis protein [Thermoanaerobaculia bacterium]